MMIFCTLSSELFSFCYAILLSLSLSLPVAMHDERRSSLSNPPFKKCGHVERNFMCALAKAWERERAICSQAYDNRP
jgi:hypothetical protein